ncbi:Fasciclin domain-containing protein [Filimonas lacunae]|uniref:Fasciclin domain-containing protein n=1 Tax=Filimonas lacunae TaxID=477680 RepID=A0A173MAG8_9BACT|nr:fasciclin domain-containing protein [Filimonas lacunae]BAV04554.1 hypothetical protein FLA_0546 [Filimonas lacunae]SIT34759.1 Fasciclin domain-containing protein [Filimonas lacunae]
MNRTITSVLLVTAAVCALAGCRKKEWDEHYERPATLEPPIYQQLQAAGKFKSLLTLIDKGGYKETLANGGYWTLFAPNDEAFTTYLQQIHKSSADDIADDTARMIVQYLLVYNSYTKARLDDYQSTASGSAGWIPSSAFRRRTAYYSGFYTDHDANGQTITAIANNRNSLAGSVAGGYMSTDYNNKYISYFIDDYFNTHQLTATDYNYFYPQTQYTGFNVGAAKVVRPDLAAENGVIHEVDKVLTPQPSIDEYVKNKPEYSSFWAILNRLKLNNMVQFAYNADATKRYNILKGNNDQVYVKVYNYLLSFSPNNENHLKAEDNDGQKDCWTLFVPDNAAVDKYVKEVLCEYYPSLDAVPVQVIADFLNAHMFSTVVWPTQFGTTRNGAGEEARFDANADVTDKQFLSNGIVYGTNKVQEANVFRTVYGKMYLNPAYQMMTRLLDVSGQKVKLTQANTQATLLLIPDTAFHTAGYYYNTAKSQWEYRTLAGTTTNGVYDKLARIVSTCVFMEPYRSQLESLAGKGIVKSGDNGIEGEYIIYNNYNIQTAALVETGAVAHVDSSKTAMNGRVYYLNSLLPYSENNIGYHIRRIGTDVNSPFNYFWQYLQNSQIYTAATNQVTGLTGGFYTVFIPDKAAIVKAVNAGLLPGTGTAPNKVPNFAPTSAADKQLVQNFIQYHILENHTVIPDGDVSGKFGTVYKNAVGTSLQITVYNSPGAMQITDNRGSVSNLELDNSNQLSNRCVIHLIDNFLNYNAQ